MTDEELMIALIRDGIPIDQVALKFETTPAEVRRLTRTMATLPRNNHGILDAKARQAGMPVQDYVSYVVKKHRGVRNAARSIGVNHMTLYRAIERFGLKPVAKVQQKIEYGGIMDTLSGHAKRFGVSPQMVRGRIECGWSLCDALITPKFGSRPVSVATQSLSAPPARCKQGSAPA